MNFGPYHAERFKEARGFGREGVPMRATLLCDAKPIGEIVDDGNGGAIRFLGIRKSRPLAEDQTALETYVATLGGEISVDFFLGMLLARAGDERDWLRTAKREAKKDRRACVFYCVADDHFVLSGNDHVRLIADAAAKGTIEAIVLDGGFVRERKYK